MSNTRIERTDLARTALYDKVNLIADEKQDALVSGTNIKTINNQSLLGSGNIEIQSGSGADLLPTNNIFTGTNVFNHPQDDIDDFTYPAHSFISNISEVVGDITTSLEYRLNGFSVCTDSFYLGAYHDNEEIDPTSYSANSYITSGPVSGLELYDKDMMNLTSGNIYIRATSSVDMSYSGRVLVPTVNNSGSINKQAVNVDYLNTQLAGYQTTSNLVTSVSSSSTDTQYPSAKCVYDIVGDIETLINAL